MVVHDPVAIMKDFDLIFPEARRRAGMEEFGIIFTKTA
jgi:hypothetical protein